MVIKVPKLLDLSDSPARCCALKAKTIWDISVPPTDSDVWSIVLAYLISSDKTKKLFTKRLNILTDKREDQKHVRKVLRNFNPFINRFSCFFNESLKNTVQQFKTKLKWDHLTIEEDELLAASDFLKCSIVVIDKDDSFRCQQFTKHESFSRNIVLFKSVILDQETTEKKVIFSFGLETKLGSKMKIQALNCFLREYQIDRNKILKIITEVKKEEDPFLIALLKNGLSDLISILYKTPYLISKIEEAGYETDPTCVDRKGLSAFYYALACEKNQICYELYEFAVNGCNKTRGIYRKPDSQVVSNLYKLKETFLSDFPRLKQTNLDKDRKLAFDTLFSLNKYLLEINQKLLKTKSSINYDDSVENKVFIVNQRLDIIISVLDTYLEHCDLFYPINEDCETSNLLHLKNYTANKIY